MDDHHEGSRSILLEPSHRSSGFVQPLNSEVARAPHLHSFAFDGATPFKPTVIVPPRGDPSMPFSKKGKSDSEALMAL